MLVGMAPDSWLLRRSKTSRYHKEPNCDGMWPISWLSFRTRCVSPSRECTSEGRVPRMREPTDPPSSSFVTRLRWL